MQTYHKKKWNLQLLLAALLCAAGVALAALKIYADSEPGAIPLLLIVAGAGWFVTARLRIRMWQK